ncbi:MAG: hypothetical protein HYR55_16050 [Acidobacteria bacterium]|nr:hypothetical protein [Acidobacteriota bacterium]MBI3657598.1 hypothetical protein [Acidobacteriota bacterium]
MDEKARQRFVAAIRKGLTDQVIAEQMDLTLDEVIEWKRQLAVDSLEAADPDS